MLVKNRTAIVTGAGTGIGKEIALSLASEGADILVHYNSSRAGAEDTAAGIKKAGRKAIIVQADLANTGDAAGLAESAVKAFGRIDILINNAGLTIFKDFFEITEEDWDRVNNTNLKGLFFLTQAAAREMRSEGYGRIINIGSVHSRSSLPGFTAYAASKGGVESLTMQAAVELAAYNITVNSLSPGLIEIKKNLLNPQYDRGHRARQIPLRRVGFPSDIAQAAVFFASEKSGYITGQTLIIDGGQLSKLGMNRNKDDDAE